MDLVGSQKSRIGILVHAEPLVREVPGTGDRRKSRLLCVALTNPIPSSNFRTKLAGDAPAELTLCHARYVMRRDVYIELQQRVVFEIVCFNICVPLCPLPRLGLQLPFPTQRSREGVWSCLPVLAKWLLQG